MDEYEIYKQVVKHNICDQLYSLLPFFIALCSVAYFLLVVPTIVARFKINVLERIVFANEFTYEKKLKVYDAMEKRDKHFMILFRPLRLDDFFTREEIEILKS